MATIKKPLAELRGPFTRQRPNYRKLHLPHIEITKQGYQLIEQLATRGCSLVTISRALGIADKTFREIREIDDRAQGAVTMGRAIEHDMLVGKLHELAMKGDTTALIFALKSRHGYRDNSHIVREHESRVKVEISLPAPLSPEQYARVIDVTPKPKAIEHG